jgi:hypothetical protein
VKIRHIKRRSHPVYDWRMVLPEPAEPAFPAHHAVFIEGLQLRSDVRPPPMTLERVRRTWGRP